MPGSAMVASGGVVIALYALLVIGLVLAGRAGDARSLVRFVPDCLVMFRRLLGDGRLPGRYRLAVLLLLAYLAMPFDLIPDFIPVAGQFDDVVLTALVLRLVLRAAEPELLAQLWPGPPEGIALIRRFCNAKILPQGAEPREVLVPHGVGIAVDRDDHRSVRRTDLR